MAPSRILVVEDDDAIGQGLASALSGLGYEVARVGTGREALKDVAAAKPALVVLDLGLPDIDGLEVCRELRRMAPEAVVIMLTARQEEIDVVVGLDAGADDYLTKPFRLGELHARIRAHLRRADTSGDAAPVALGNLTIDPGARRVEVAGRELALRAREFDLLVLLARQAGQVVSRDRLMAEVWDPHWHGSTKTLDMHISWLRRKLADASATAGITTLRSVGYRLEVP